MTVSDLCLDGVIDGAVNFRDLGGLPAGEGCVRRGLVYRSGMTHHISSEGMRLLAEQYGLRMVIDLRSSQELERGLATWQTAGITHHHLPVLSDTSATVEEVGRRYAEMASGSFDWTELYIRMLEQGAPAFRQTFTLLAQPGTLPAVFHCAGGRDRTGVTAALLLAILGVPEEMIARDYALTGTYLLPHLDRFMGAPDRMPLSREEMERLLQTRDESMTRFLAVVTEQHGSPEGYLTAVGVDGDAIAVLRDGLIE